MGFGFPKAERDGLIASDPETFFLPPTSDLRYQWVCAHLRAAGRRRRCASSSPTPGGCAHRGCCTTCPTSRSRPWRRTGSCDAGEYGGCGRCCTRTCTSTDRDVSLRGRTNVLDWLRSTGVKLPTLVEVRDGQIYRWVSVTLSRQASGARLPSGPRDLPRVAARRVGHVDPEAVRAVGKRAEGHLVGVGAGQRSAVERAGPTGELVGQLERQDVGQVGRSLDRVRRRRRQVLERGDDRWQQPGAERVHLDRVHLHARVATGDRRRWGCSACSAGSGTAPPVSRDRCPARGTGRRSPRERRPRSSASRSPRWLACRAGPRPRR